VECGDVEFFTTYGPLALGQALKEGEILTENQVIQSLYNQHIAVDMYPDQKPTGTEWTKASSSYI